FTNKAAREMLGRVNELLPRRPRGADGEKPERPTLCTFHSLGVRILRQHIEKLGYKRNFVIYDEGDQQGAMKKVLSSLTTKAEKTDPAAVLALLSKFKNNGPDDPAFADENVRALVDAVSRRYETALRAANAVDFDDLILLTLRLFQEHPDALDSCRARWPYVMVDEYQDTNGTQFEVVHSLTRESRNLCVVGDDDQSIYGWRGARIANILNLEEHFPEVKVIKLEQNYRSTNIILKAANAVIRNNPRRRGKNLWSSKGEGDRIALYAFETDETEAQTVADNIEYDRLARRIGWGRQAILFRTNLQSRALEQALRKARVRYRLIGGQSFFDRREIRDFLAYLKTFANPDDDVSLLRIANTPARGLSDVTLERLLAASAERKTSVYAVLRHTDVLDSFPPRTREAIRGFQSLVERMREPLAGADPVSLAACAEGWLGETGYFDELRRTEKDPEVAENRVRNVRELVVELDGPLPEAPPGPPTPPGLPKPPPPPVPRIPRYRGAPQDRLDDFLADLTLDRDRSDDAAEPGDVVTLITMHAAKGLEFPHVHIVGVEDGLLPHTRSKLEGTLDEERRLFYVAITRAQETLKISHCGARRRYGQLLPCHPSPFLKELPPDCVENADQAGSTVVENGKGDDLFAALRAVLED
ncbi:MAG: ATP-dependent helicase, partial [Verrucomicrobiota bacterium]